MKVDRTIEQTSRPPKIRTESNHFNNIFTYFREFTKNTLFTQSDHYLGSGIKISTSESKMVVEVPFPCTDGFYYKKNNDKIKLSNDLRLVRNQDDKILLPMVNNGFLSATNQIHKNRSPLNKNAYKIGYPFLDHDIVDLGLNHARYWPGNEIKKRTLKYMLIPFLKPELVYRQKQGFLPPLAIQFSHPIFLDHLVALRRSDSLLYYFINQDFLNQVVGYLEKQEKLPIQTYNFLWAAMFTNTWLTQIKNH